MAEKRFGVFGEWQEQREGISSFLNPAGDGEFLLFLAV